MPIRLECQCGKQYSIRNELSGRTLKCKSCGTAIRVPNRRVTRSVATDDDDNFLSSLETATRDAARAVRIPREKKEKKKETKKRGGHQCSECGSSDTRKPKTREAVEYNAENPLSRFGIRRIRYCNSCKRGYEIDVPLFMIILLFMVPIAVICLGVWILYVGNQENDRGETLSGVFIAICGIIALIRTVLGRIFR